MKICIYCSSSDHIDKKYFVLANKLGKIIGQSGYDLVFGGVDAGLMGEVAKSAKSEGSHIIGVVPEKIHLNKKCYKDCDKLIVTKDMRSRKQKMEELSDAFIALPGGLGTIEELTEIMTAKQLTYHNKPIIMLDKEDFYSNLDKFFKNIVSEKFAHKGFYRLYYKTDSPLEAMKYIEEYIPEKIILKWSIKK